MLRCPKCSLVNPDGAERCDCGWEISTSKLGSAKRQPPKAPAVTPGTLAAHAGRLIRLLPGLVKKKILRRPSGAALFAFLGGYVGPAFIHYRAIEADILKSLIFPFELWILAFATFGIVMLAITLFMGVWFLPLLIALLKERPWAFWIGISNFFFPWIVVNFADHKFSDGKLTLASLSLTWLLLLGIALVPRRRQERPIQPDPLPPEDLETIEKFRVDVFGECPEPEVKSIRERARRLFDRPYGLLLKQKKRES